MEKCFFLFLLSPPSSLISLFPAEVPRSHACNITSSVLDRNIYISASLAFLQFMLISLILCAPFV